jgi:hypothetical protein
MMERTDTEIIIEQNDEIIRVLSLILSEIRHNQYGD